MIRKTLSLPDDMGEWIAGRIASGRYNNDSEYVRDLIRRDQDEQRKAERLQAALDAAEADLAAGRHQDLATKADVTRLMDAIEAEASG
ncbi:MAG: type II toxin-antitoxin system ParD family antitoxin [Maricaulaceae bacterium]|nr:type II toxin-antitoxin system ParD family antitoxin [Maricaulaceae bacterium]